MDDVIFLEWWSEDEKSWMRQCELQTEDPYAALDALYRDGVEWSKTSWRVAVYGFRFANSVNPEGEALADKERCPKCGRPLDGHCMLCPVCKAEGENG